ncbi:MAG: hypothetical protein EA402_09480 [Planctomycetota bacterium]|nr:MAG: hypothetical protein EA402_09480 [Planctomycetota bacterium]
MAILNRQQIIEAISNGAEFSYEIQSTSTLTINNSLGDMIGYASGDVLNLFMIELIDEHLGKVNLERIEKLKELVRDGKRPSIQDIITASIDPLIDGLSKESARLLRFSHVAINLQQIDISRRYWWTMTLTETLMKMHEEKLSTEQKRMLYSHYRGRVATFNYCLYHFIGRNSEIDWSKKLPIKPEGRSAHLDWLHDVALAILQPPEWLKDVTGPNKNSD